MKITPEQLVYALGYAHIGTLIASFVLLMNGLTLAAIAAHTLYVVICGLFAVVPWFSVDKWERPRLWLAGWIVMAHPLFFVLFPWRATCGFVACFSLLLGVIIVRESLEPPKPPRRRKPKQSKRQRLSWLDFQPAFRGGAL